MVRFIIILDCQLVIFIVRSIILLSTLQRKGELSTKLADLSIGFFILGHVKTFRFIFSTLLVTCNQNLLDSRHSVKSVIYNYHLSYLL